MSELERIILTSAITVVGATLVFVLGQITSRFFIEPCYEQRVVIGRIAEALLTHMHFFVYSGKDQLQGTRVASEQLRKLSAELMARTVSVPGYGFLSVLRLVQKQVKVNDASRGLVYISNTVGDVPEPDSKEGAFPPWKLRMSRATVVAKSLGIQKIDPEFQREDDSL